MRQLCNGLPFASMVNAGGKASSVVPLTALYPLVTILLAVTLLRERLNPLQVGGMALSLVAIYLFNDIGVRGLAGSWLLYALVPIVLWGVSALLQEAERRGRLESNGIRFVLMPDETTQLAEVDIRYDVGSREDPPGRAGLAHLVEHLMFQTRPDGPNTAPMFQTIAFTMFSVDGRSIGTAARTKMSSGA